MIGKLNPRVYSGFLAGHGGGTGVEQVRVTVHGSSEKAGVEVTWAGGHRTSAQITRPVACLTQLSYYPQPAARRWPSTSGGCTTWPTT
jgi:hypothetical protein